MMSTVAHFYPFVIGVDTHARSYVILDMMVVSVLLCESWSQRGSR